MLCCLLLFELTPHNTYMVDQFNMQHSERFVVVTKSNSVNQTEIFMFEYVDINNGYSCNYSYCKY